MLKVTQELRDKIFADLDALLLTENGEEKLESKFMEYVSLANVEEEEVEIDEKIVLRTSQLCLCPRKEYYRTQGFKSYFDAQSFFTLSAGVDIHKRVQSVLDVLGILIEREGLLLLDYTNFYIAGHFDGLISYNNDTALIEIKTMSPFAMQKVLKEIAELEKDYNLLNDEMIMQKYLKQSSTYLFMLYITKQIDLRDKMHWFIFVNKANVKGIPPIFTLQFTYDEKLVNNLLGDAVNLYKNIEQKIEPQPVNNWECGYCGYLNCPFNRRLKNGEKQN